MSRLHVACIAALVATAPACKSSSDSGETATSTGGSTKKGQNRSGKVSVLYAGSLVNLMENDLGPAFAKSSGLRYEGEGKGSNALANMIKDKLRQPDVFVSASAKVNELLMDDAGGRQVTWYAVVFGNEMVIAYSPKSALASKFEEVKAGKLAFYEPLLTKGIKLGRTDPKLDPKGFRTLMMFDLASTFYKQPGLTKQILGDAENPDQTFPEEQLVARLESGQIDAGVFYRNEAEEHHLPYVTLPHEINLGDPAMNDRYKVATYKNPDDGNEFHGGAIVYTVTVPETAKNREGGAAFVAFMLSPEGKALLEQHGLPTIQPTITGDAAALPPAVRSVLPAAAGAN